MFHSDMLSEGFQAMLLFRKTSLTVRLLNCTTKPEVQLLGNNLVETDVLCIVLVCYLFILYSIFICACP